MSIEKDYSEFGYGDFVLSCDNCLSTPPVAPFSTFSEAVTYKRVNGWRSIKVNDEWIDLCPTCAKRSGRDFYSLVRKSQ